jgi:hypothetical protein
MARRDRRFPAAAVQDCRPVRRSTGPLGLFEGEQQTPRRFRWGPPVESAAFAATG